MISAMRWTAKVPDVQSQSAAVRLELSWDQTGRRAMVRQAAREEDRRQINCVQTAVINQGTLNVDEQEMFEEKQ